MTEPSLEIAQIGNPVLRQTAEWIDRPQDRAYQILIADLLQTMTQSAGVGIAATQVGVAKQLVIVASRPTLRYPNAPQISPIPMFNPQLVEHSDETEKGWEGCLSVPGIRGLVPRYKSVTVEYQDRDGQTQQLILHDFVARVFQHEYDHLQGIVFVDRVENTTELMSELEYQRQILGIVPNP
ncbi:MAG: peptide deformylase [Acaryochloridaceae cyanobacterium RU_4_10]|nr:peptide deformylase [Acaryochloridaceae cyanobacterium RU_4_10]